ncbi:MAG: secondary thiamine-phosphate synthase enzyme YjbQ [Candidatus Brocadiia bacterium]
MDILSVNTRSKTEFTEITSRVQEAVAASGLEEGVCMVYVPHTTAGVTINENADPTVRKDILKELNSIVPFEDNYAHMEGNSAAHIKSSLVGCSCMVPIRDGRLALGRWQGVFFCEFDGPRSRKVWVTCT